MTNHPDCKNHEVHLNTNMFVHRTVFQKVIAQTATSNQMSGKLIYMHKYCQITPTSELVLSHKIHLHMKNVCNLITFREVIARTLTSNQVSEKIINLHKYWWIISTTSCHQWTIFSLLQRNQHQVSGKLNNMA